MRQGSCLSGSLCVTPWWLLAARLADAPGDAFLRAPSGMAHSVTEEALSGLAYVMLATGGASPCPPDLGDTVPEPGRRIPKEMLRKTENAFRGPSACTQTPSPGSPCEGAAHLPPPPLRPPARQRLCAQCSRHSDSSHPHRVRVPCARDPSLRRPLPFLQNGARFRPKGRSR